MRQYCEEMWLLLTFHAVLAVQFGSSPANTVEWRHCGGEGGRKEGGKEGGRREGGKEGAMREEGRGRRDEGEGRREGRREQ